MDQEPDVIRQEIEQTRSSLSEKIETLENQVLSTVQNAKQTVEGTIENVKDTVEETIENVKSSVSETVESVKETFSLERQVERHPWAMVGGSFAVGFLVGNLVESRRGPASWHAREMTGLMSESSRYPATYQETGRPYPTESRPTPPARAAGAGWFDRLLTQFQPEINRAKEVAIGALVGLARDYAKSQLPQPLATKVDEIMNDITTKVGGEPLREPILRS